MPLLIVLLLLVGGIILGPVNPAGAALAAPVYQAYPNHSQARLISSSAQVSATQDTLIGLQLKLDPEWHTYWQNPGDSGAAPILNFKAEPDILEFSAVQWPIPKRIPVPPLMTFGYEQDVMFWVKARLREPAAASQPIKVKLEAEWLVCKVECIPAFDTLNLNLQSTATAPRPQPESAEFERYPLPQANVMKQPYLLEGSSSVVLQASGLPEQAKILDFMPLNNDHLGNQAPVLTGKQTAEKGLILTLKEAPAAQPPALNGLLIWSDAAGQPSAAYLDAQVQAVPPPAPLPLWQFLAMAFIGGAILNLMPCVFPILAIKLLGLMRHAEQQPRTIRVHSLAYILGAELTFVGFALTLAALRSGGQALGWGFQLQSTPALTALILLFFLLALNFLGLYEFRLPMVFSGKQHQNALWGQFSAGVLAVLVASPCTAPFMGAAMGFALTQSTLVLVSVFMALGLGFCLPYLLLLLSPKVVSYLPKPGAWMELLKEAMAFPMLLTALWLLWILARMLTTDGLIAILAGLLMLSVPFWWARHQPRKLSRVLSWLISLPLAAALLIWPNLPQNQASAELSSGAQSAGLWTPFSPAKLVELKAQGPVFLDFTAAWCITCQVNEQVTFSQPEVQAAVKEYGVAMLKADWTRRDPDITQLLSQYGRISVPFYLLYLPGKPEPVILPELLTPNIFLDALKQHLAKEVTS